jgi:hypothetical protein
MLRAKTLQHAESEKADYYAGYRRGLLRAFRGEAFGTEQEHARYLSLVHDLDESSKQRGQGYRDGLKTIEEILESEGACSGC